MIFDVIKRHKKIILMSIATIIAAFALYGWLHRSHDKTIEVITETSAQSPSELAKNQYISEKEASDIIYQVEHKPPDVTYYVSAPSVQVAAEKTAKAIEKKDVTLPAAVTAKSDRTAVVANEEEQKVDVYKINLNKAHRIKGGLVVEGSRVYPAVGYEAGRFEGIAYFDNKKLKGAAAMYTVAQW